MLTTDVTFFRNKQKTVEENYKQILSYGLIFLCFYAYKNHSGLNTFIALGVVQRQVKAACIDKTCTTITLCTNDEGSEKGEKRKNKGKTEKDDIMLKSGH